MSDYHTPTQACAFIYIDSNKHEVYMDTVKSVSDKLRSAVMGESSIFQNKVSFILSIIDTNVSL